MIPHRIEESTPTSTWRIHRFTMFVLVVFVVAGLAGCQAKLNVVQTFTIPQVDKIGQTYIMPAQAREQTITVAITVKSGPNVDVYVVPSNLVGDNLDLKPSEKKEWETKGFGSKRDVKTGTVSAKVPAKTEYKVLILQTEGAKEKSNVDVKITN